MASQIIYIVAWGTGAYPNIRKKRIKKELKLNN